MVGCVGTKVGQNDGRDKEGNLHISIGGSPTERTEKNAKTYDIFMVNKEKFEQENPGVIVAPDAWSFDLKNYMTKAEGGDLPTMYFTPPTEINNIVENGYAADITNLVKKYGYDKMLNDEFYIRETINNLEECMKNKDFVPANECERKRAEFIQQYSDWKIVLSHSD